MVSKILFLLLGLAAIFSCDRKNPYEKMLEEELASGTRSDSLFLGIYLGMPSKEFYDHCWDMNRKGLIRQGVNNTTVYARVSNFGEPASMNFYPTFFEDKIAVMPVDFAYESWAPWNQNLHADSLMLEVKDLVENWHGKKQDFIRVKNPNEFIGGIGFVKVEGNRRTFIRRIDEMTVRVEFTDMIAKQKMEAQQKLTKQ